MWNVDSWEIKRQIHFEREKLNNKTILNANLWPTQCRIMWYGSMPCDYNSVDKPYSLQHVSLMRTHDASRCHTHTRTHSIQLNSVSASVAGAANREIYSRWFSKRHIHPPIACSTSINSRTAHAGMSIDGWCLVFRYNGKCPKKNIRRQKTMKMRVQSAHAVNYSAAHSEFGF